MPKSVSTARVRRQFPGGLTSAQLIAEANRHLPRAVKIPTLRKYIQAGLVNRAVRSERRTQDGQSGGSSGIYAPESVAQLVAAYRAYHSVPIGTSRADALALCQVRASRGRAIVAARAVALCAAQQAKQLADKAIGRRLVASARKGAAAAIRALEAAC